MAKRKRNAPDATLRNVRASNRRTTDIHKRLKDLADQMNEIHRSLLELQAEMLAHKPARERRRS